MYTVNRLGPLLQNFAKKSIDDTRYDVKRAVKTTKDEVVDSELTSDRHMQNW